MDDLGFSAARDVQLAHHASDSYVIIERNQWEEYVVMNDIEKHHPV